ncbi:MAG: thiamine pyrophosphate-binding protein [Anaerolineae bacterium]|nr:thiamine pyrophosphate-binding protein [Anaerolineae bacterium]
MLTIAQVLARQLYDEGVRTAFGLPGGEIVEVVEALRQVGIDFVLVRNESSAVYMADVAARLTGNIGVAVTTLGPGAANAYAGLAHAYLDRSPVLLITAQTDPQRVGTHTHQVLDLQACFQPVTKFTAELEVASAQETIDYALSRLKAGRPGPSHLGLCSRVANSAIPIVDRKRRAPRDADLAAHATAIQDILNRSLRPVIVVGLGLEPERPYREVQALAEALGAPVIDTPKAKGALPANHPLLAGTIGLTTTDPAYTILDRADCIIAVGFDVVELVKPWSQAAPLIWIAPWENADPHLPAAHEYVGDIGALLRVLAETVKPRHDLEWGMSTVIDHRDRLAAQAQPHAAAGHVSPQEALKAIRKHTPDDIIITTDVGSHKIFTALSWPAQTPNRYFVSNGLSAMGFGVPAAIAAAYVTRQPALCITGDAGLGMVIGELSLAVEYDLPVIVVVMNDSALDLIRTAQQRRNLPVYGTTFTNPSYASIADAYGMAYHHVESVAACEAAIQSALLEPKPCLIDVQIDPSGYPTAVKT